MNSPWPICIHSLKPVSYPLPSGIIRDVKQTRSQSHVYSMNMKFNILARSLKFKKLQIKYDKIKNTSYQRQIVNPLRSRPVRGLLDDCAFRVLDFYLWLFNDKMLRPTLPIIIVGVLKQVTVSREKMLQLRESAFEKWV